MTLCSVVLIGLAVALDPAASAQSPQTSAPAADAPNLSGVWVLNPSSTQRPAEIGFEHSWARAGRPGSESASESRSGGRGRHGSGSGATAAPAIVRESADDSTRAEQLTAEARTPATHLTIVQTPEKVSMADEQGLTRTFHPNGRVEELTIGTVPLPTTARWDAGSLTVVYDVESGWQLRYKYTPSADPKQLRVDIRFIQQGREGDDVQLTYEPPGASDRNLLETTTRRKPDTAAAAPPAGSEGATTPAFGARPAVLPPGSELRGITTIGTQIDNLTAPAAACGLDQSKIKTAVARILSDAGFKTLPDGTEENYVLVAIVTSRLADGTCVSRYDTSLIAQADATLPYLRGLVAVEVPLLHDGGLAGGSPAAHAKSVTDAVTNALTRFVSRIREASK